MKTFRLLGIEKGEPWRVIAVDAIYDKVTNQLLIDEEGMWVYDSVSKLDAINEFKKAFGKEVTKLQE